ncbi:MAG TPA: phosphatase PAP2 family protein [Ramlibacter sp.]|nr:phosphatase PAP2 family protein [Ramlibacter sp.]
MQLSTLRAAWISAAALTVVLLWDASGLDLALAHTAGDTHGFFLRDNWLLTNVLHTGAKQLAWLMIVALCLAVVWPIGALRQLPVARRAQAAASALLASAFIALLKTGSHTSCPWDLHEFGGVARYVSHWAGWIDYDGGAGRCFPAGHATTGFAFLGGYFALRHDLPRLAKTWAAMALAAGLALGIAQQLRGAHFMSHTLWTAWLCWMVGWAIDPFFVRRGAVFGDEAIQ